MKIDEIKHTNEAKKYTDIDQITLGKKNCISKPEHTEPIDETFS